MACSPECPHDSQMVHVAGAGRHFYCWPVYMSQLCAELSVQSCQKHQLKLSVRVTIEHIVQNVRPT